MGQAASYIQNSYVPLPFVLMLLLQFLSMLIDRFVTPLITAIMLLKQG